MTFPNEHEEPALVAVVRTQAAISVDKVSHRFTAGARDVLAISSVSFEIGRGDFVAVVGPSGCGKTTILNMAAGLVTPSSGSVSIDAQVVSRPSRRVGYMTARDGLMPWRTAIGNVEFGMELRGMPRGERRAEAQRYLDLVGLTGFEQNHPSQLSQGMRQRAAVARTLATKPDVLLMDEPFAALDALTKMALQAEFLRIWEKLSTTVMWVTHDLEEAVTMSDRVLVMTGRPSRIKADIKIDLRRPRDPASTRFDPHAQELVKSVWEQLGEAAGMQSCALRVPRQGAET